MNILYFNIIYEITRFKNLNALLQIRAHKEPKFHLQN